MQKMEKYDKWVKNHNSDFLILGSNIATRGKEIDDEN